MARILVVDNGPFVVRSLMQSLSQAGHNVECAPTALDTLEAVQRHPFDIIILDWSLPDRSGLQVVRELRAAGSTAYIIMAAARGNIGFKVAALEEGADDYLVKPFGHEELLARIGACERRVDKLTRVGPITLNLDRRRLFVHDLPVPATGTEFRLLECLAERPNRLVRRTALIARTWPAAAPKDAGHALDVHIGNLRRKLGDAADAIETVRGEGFLLRDPPPLGPEGSPGLFLA